MKLSIATRMALQEKRLDRKVRHQARMLMKQTKRAQLKSGTIVRPKSRSRSLPT